jgi:hypothetical protein
MRRYIDQRASAEPRAAIAEIGYGLAGGNGEFKMFAATLTYQLEPEFVPIEMKVFLPSPRPSYQVVHEHVHEETRSCTIVESANG